MGHSASKQPRVSTKEELTNPRNPYFCDKLLGRLYRENLAPYAREAIPITAITPKAQHCNVMGAIVPRVIASTYLAPPQDLTLVPSTSHMQSQEMAPKHSTRCASIYTLNPMSRKDTMSPIDHSMHRCPQRVRSSPRPRVPLSAVTNATSATSSHRSSTASTPPKYSASKYWQEEEEEEEEGEEEWDDYDDDGEEYEESKGGSDEDDIDTENYNEEDDEVAKPAVTFETLRQAGRTRKSVHDSQGGDICPPTEFILPNAPVPLPFGTGAAKDIIKAPNKGKGKQNLPWPSPISEACPEVYESATEDEEVDRWQDGQQFLFRHERPSFQDLSARVMPTIKMTGGKEKSFKAQDSKPSQSKRQADKLEAKRTNKRHINSSQVQTRMQSHLRDERKKQEAADLAYATKLFEEERQKAEATQKSTPQPKECTVCSEVLHPLSFSAKPPTSTCAHTVSVCETCLQEWVSNQLSSNGWQSIHCPECPSTLSHAEMRLAASPATFVLYDTLSLRSTISALQNFAWCLAPHCNFGQENLPNAHGAFMECTSCRYRQCLKHRCEWHDGESCDQYDYRVTGRKAKAEEAMNKKYLDKEAKQCPGKGCGAYIQKSSGCDHMTCRKCGTEFCYLCQATYSRIRAMGNAAHSTECRYHSDNLYPH